MSFTLDSKRRPFRLSVLAGPVVAANAEGGVIEGHWHQRWPRPEALERRFGRETPFLPGQVLEDFANDPATDQSVLAFTQRYGPLSTSASQGASFSFSCDEWRAGQQLFRQEWRRRLEFSIVRVTRLPTEAGEVFRFLNDELEFIAGTLLRYMRLELQALDVAALRICRHDECQHPYFMARHHKQEYCSEECSNWAQKRAKLQWWTTVGEPRRQRQLAATKKKRRKKAVTKRPARRKT